MYSYFPQLGSCILKKSAIDRNFWLKSYELFWTKWRRKINTKNYNENCYL